MKHFKTHNNQLSLSKTITITTKYSERFCSYRQTSSGGSYVVDFCITVQQNESDEVIVYFVEDDDTKIAIEFISEGIDKYIDDLRQHDVSLQGVDIIIEKAIVDDVDFKSFRYSIATIVLMRRIFFTHGKYILSKTFDSNIKVVEFPEKHIFSQFEDLKVRKSFLLPNTLQKVLKFPDNFFLNKELVLYDSIISIELATDYYSQRRINEVYLYADNNPESIQLFLLATDVIKKLIADVYENQYNLMSFHVGIRDKKTEFSDLVNYVDFQSDLYWFFKNIILTHNQIGQI
ncbi:MULTISPECIES: hypothetical protein [unclassified Arcicella]|uniref:hypothetical protein n=1 Tax=unclassified Arcicella TaxID=2644986 RepID=UPI0028569904|nr:MULTISPECIES: hypothetical protein [unclassified Arcicella]MDR6563263.1 hypothetical protein [Arcicella sp. BE51]MDR6811586.1 hypothetical protein [Arcicella sp. BE140]MDR6823112.1 hypothetical protein [Arcicella sp. BE139]